MTRFGVVVRADNLRNLTAVGWRALAEHGVRRIVDLRWQEELDEEPTGEAPVAVEVVHVPVFGRHRPQARYVRYATLAAEVEHGSEFTRRLYGEYLDEFPEQFAAAVDAVAHAPGGALVHCRAGKDRTGLVAALVLRIAGVGIDSIADDYAISDVREMANRGLLDGMSDDETLAREYLLAAPRDGMAGLLLDLDARHGSADAYLHAAGLDPHAAQALRARLTGEVVVG